MDPIIVDSKRTVKARKVHVFDEDGSAPNGIDAQPGDSQPMGGGRLKFACPGCGQWGSIYCSHPKRTETWDIIEGSVEDPETLTLDPSIFCVTCCQWHGYLKAGVYESC